MGASMLSPVPLLVLRLTASLLAAHAGHDCGERARSGAELLVALRAGGCTSLEYKGAALSDMELQDLRHWLHASPSLREIELTRVPLGDAAVSILAPAIASQVAGGCRSLELEFAGITDTGAVALAKALQATAPSWAATSHYQLSLSLAGNSIGDLAMIDVAKILPYLHELDLSDTAITDVGLASIEAGIAATQTQLKEIELKRTGLTEGAVQKLRHAVGNAIKVDFRSKLGSQRTSSPLPTMATAPTTPSPPVTNTEWGDVYDAIEELQEVGHLSEKAAAVLRRKAAEDDKAVGRVYSKYAEKFAAVKAGSIDTDTEAARLVETLAKRLLELVPKDEL